MTRDNSRRKQGLANASVNTSVRGGEHDGETDDSTPSNLGLPGNDQQRGLDDKEDRKPSKSRGPHPGADAQKD
jgi:hypothetical protein